MGFYVFLFRSYWYFRKILGSFSRFGCCGSLSTCRGFYWSLWRFYGTLKATKSVGGRFCGPRGCLGEFVWLKENVLDTLGVP